MISLLDDIAILHNKDQICIFDRRKSVCNNKACSALHQVVHCFLDLHFCSGIDRRCCLIKDQDLVVCKNCSCNGKKLFLSLRDIACLLIQLPSDSRQECLHDEVMDMSSLCRCNNFFVCCIQTSVTDIFHDRS